jgi:hypothetical protein
MKKLCEGTHRGHDWSVYLGEDGLWGEAVGGYIGSDGIGDFKNAEDVKGWLLRQIDIMIENDRKEERRVWITVNQRDDGLVESW